MSGMVREAEPIDIAEITDRDPLLRLLEDVRSNGKSRVLQRDGEDLAVLSPIPILRRKRIRARPLTKDDPLFRLVGVARSGIEGRVSGKKHEYLRRVYDLHR
jgi:hypothetical protein